MYFSLTSTFNNECDRKRRRVLCLGSLPVWRREERPRRAGRPGIFRKSTSTLLRKCSSRVWRGFPRPMLAAGFPNSPWTPLFHHNLRGTTQKGLPFASTQSSLVDIPCGHSEAAVRARFPAGRGVAVGGIRCPLLCSYQLGIVGELRNLLPAQNGGRNSVAAHFQIGLGLVLLGKPVPAAKTLSKRAHAEHVALHGKRGGCVGRDFHQGWIKRARGSFKTKSDIVPPEAFPLPATMRTGEPHLRQRTICVPTFACATCTLTLRIVRHDP